MSTQSTFNLIHFIFPINLSNLLYLYLADDFLFFAFHSSAAAPPNRPRIDSLHPTRSDRSIRPLRSLSPSASSLSPLPAARCSLLSARHPTPPIESGRRCAAAVQPTPTCRWNHPPRRPSAHTSSSRRKTMQRRRRSQMTGQPPEDTRRASVRTTTRAQTDEWIHAISAARAEPSVATACRHTDDNGVTQLRDDCREMEVACEACD